VKFTQFEAKFQWYGGEKVSRISLSLWSTVDFSRMSAFKLLRKPENSILPPFPPSNFTFQCLKLYFTAATGNTAYCDGLAVPTAPASNDLMGLKTLRSVLTLTTRVKKTLTLHRQPTLHHVAALCCNEVRGCFARQTLAIDLFTPGLLHALLCFPLDLQN
jgi:hypothetical protein